MLGVKLTQSQQPRSNNSHPLSAHADPVGKSGLGDPGCQSPPPPASSDVISTSCSTALCVSQSPGAGKSLHLNPRTAEVELGSNALSAQNDASHKTSFRYWSEWGPGDKGHAAPTSEDI